MNPRPRTHQKAKGLSGTCHQSPPEASERDTPKDRERIDWKLLTDLPVRTRQEAAEKLDWYAQRWKIRDLPQNPEVWMQGGRSETEEQPEADLSTSLPSYAF